MDPRDTPAQRLAERCLANVETPPGDDWQGAVWLRDK
jgi:hypothetical protein